MSRQYQPKTGEPCTCRRGVQRDNCPACEGTGMRIDFRAIRKATATPATDSKITSAELYQRAKDAGIEIDSHESDLYLPVNETTKALVDRYQFKSNVQTFRSQIDGTMWYDVPFAYQPFWDRRQQR